MRKTVVYTTKISTKVTMIEIFYSIFVALSLILHVFNTYGFTDELKYFHVPAAAAFLLSFFLPCGYDKFRKVIFLFVVWSGIASMFSPYSHSLNSYVTFAIVIGGMLGVKYVRGDRIIHMCNILIPFVLFALLGIYALYVKGYFRFTGFYNDPNYLCVTLITFLILITREFQFFNSIYVKIALLLELGVVLFLITATVSRMGLVCAIFILSVIFYGYSKKYFLRTIMVIFLFVGVLYIWKGESIKHNIEMFEMRTEQGDNYVSASDTRLRMSMRGINYVLDHPIYLLQGMGIGGVNHPLYFEEYYTSEKRIDHNTFTSIFSEQGLVGLCLYMYALYIQAKSLWWRRKKLGGRINLMSFVVMLLFSASINTLKYLPFWFTLFFVDRKYDNIEQ